MKKQFESETKEEFGKWKKTKMGVMPVNKLLISMALPMMISMLVQALYNIVDSMFVAQISENALTAVSLAFPAQNLMIAVGTGTGVGINALVSRSLGERNGERANLIANNGLLLYVLSGIVFALFGIFWQPPVFPARRPLTLKLWSWGHSICVSAVCFPQQSFCSSGLSVFCRQRQNHLYHADTGAWRNREYHSGPDSDFRAVRRTEAWRKRCGCGDRFRADLCGKSGLLLQ